MPSFRTRFDYFEKQVAPNQLASVEVVEAAQEDMVQVKLELQQARDDIQEIRGALDV